MLRVDNIVDNIRIRQLNPAAEKGDLDLVKKIIQDHNELKLRPNSFTILKAIMSGNLDLLQYFEDTFSITPSHLSENERNEAIRYIKNTEMLKHLLLTYPDFRLGLGVSETNIVARSGNIENLKLLLSLRTLRANSDTLYGAVKSRNMDCIRFLVEDYKIDGELVITDYDESIALAESNKLENIASYLREKQPQLKSGQAIFVSNTVIATPIQPERPLTSVQLQSTTSNSSNEVYNELFDACKNQRPHDVKRLLDKGTSPNICDAEGNTPLFYAVQNSDFDSVDHLCAADTDVNVKNKNEETPLIYVYEKCRSEIPLQLLLAKGANPYIKSRYGSLFELAKKEHRIVELGILHEWEMDNPEAAKKLKIEAEKPTLSQDRKSPILAKPFIASPIHTASAYPVKKAEKVSPIAESEQPNIN